MVKFYSAHISQSRFSEWIWQVHDYKNFLTWTVRDTRYKLQSWNPLPKGNDELRMFHGKLSNSQLNRGAMSPRLFIDLKTFTYERKAPRPKHKVTI